jgi:hypothetical protein
MKVYFATKEENNQRRQEEFLKLSPVERLESFLRDSSINATLPQKEDISHPNDKKGNFVIDLTNGKFLQ